MKRIIFFSIVCLVLSSCTPASSIIRLAQPASVTIATAVQPQATILQPTAKAIFTPTEQASVAVKIPNFDHIVLIVLENEYLQNVVGSTLMPHLNALAQQYVLLSNYFAIGHPSLPNYLAMVSGSTQNITSDCDDCFVNQPNLADEIEASRRTWKSYLEDMPSPCFIGNARPYVQMFNPFLYFDSIRLDVSRCERSIVPLTQLDSDLAANQLPNFSFIMPNLCNSGHDCSPETADDWMNKMVTKLQASSALGEHSLIIITFDEGGDQAAVSCCGTGIKTRGQVATVLISPLAQQGFNDPTSYSHYSLLKTILIAWDLPALGQTQENSIQPIKAPWKTSFGSTIQDDATTTP